MYRDRTGKRLSDYPRPSVAVDVALLSVVWGERTGQLAVLLHQPHDGFAAGSWCLPGTFVHDDELLTAAVLRALRDKVGVSGRSPQQLKVFDALDRDARGRVLSVAHVDVVAEHALQPSGSRWCLAPIDSEAVRVPGRQTSLPYDHDLIVREAVRWVRAAHDLRPDPFRVLPEQFTLADVQQLHEAVAGHRLVKDTFRRGIHAALTSTGQERSGTVGRPAALFRHPTAAPG